MYPTKETLLILNTEYNIKLIAKSSKRFTIIIDDYIFADVQINFKELANPFLVKQYNNLLREVEYSKPILPDIRLSYKVKYCLANSVKAINNMSLIRARNTRERLSKEPVGYFSFETTMEKQSVLKICDHLISCMLMERLNKKEK